MLSTLQKATLNFYWDSLVNSYSQMFFSNNKSFAYLLLIATFINPSSGICGLFAVVSAILFSKWLSFDVVFIRTGSYSFNALMVGLVMGLYYSFSPTFLITLLLFAFITVIISKAMYVVFAKYQVPILGLPFIFSVWLLFLSSRSFHSLDFNDNGLFVYNDLFATGGMTLVNVYDAIKDFHLPNLIESYFKSLGAIYFQYNIIAGILIAIGLLIYSRIAFTLSIIGFITGYYFIYFMSGSVSEVNYNFIGFNYILASISLGGFYLIPSKSSYALAVVSTLVIAVLLTTMSHFFRPLQLPLYSFPSSIVVILVVLVLKHRPFAKRLQLVAFQSFSPEKNKYMHTHRAERFKNNTYYQIHFPFFGEWYISQGHDGKITHLDDWKYAWDFVVTDDMKKTFRMPGNELTDFYCYNVPVLAPAGGYVITIIDEVDDNKVGDVDTINNWGNTIILKHGEDLFSKICHIKRGSFRVHVGDYVHPGDWLANCGNSGRSPEPHIHFQLQTTPFIGSKTLKYPISYFMTHADSEYKFHSFEYPKEQATVSAIRTTPLIVNAFSFIPGKKLLFEVTDGGKKETCSWESFTDAYNSTYLYCSKTNSSAYFVNNGTLHYFTEFYGDKKSLLYFFFIGCHKIVLGYYQDMKVPDLLPIEGLYGGVNKVIQDFLAPFTIYLNTTYQSVFKKIDDWNFPKQITIASEAKVMMGKRKQKEINFEIVLANDSIETFKVINNNQEIVARCIGEE